MTFHQPGLHGTIGNLIVPSSKLKVHSYHFLRDVEVITANPEILLVQTLLRLASKLPIDLVSSSWVELRLLYRLQLSVNGRGEAVAGFVMSQEKIDVACSHTLRQEEYFQLQKRLRDTLSSVDGSQNVLKEEIAKLKANKKKSDSSSVRRELDNLKHSASICQEKLDALLYFSQYFQVSFRDVCLLRKTDADALTSPEGGIASGDSSTDSSRAARLSRLPRRTSQCPQTKKA